VLVTLGFVGSLLWWIPGLDPSKLTIFDHLQSQWWRTFTAPFIYDNAGYTIVALAVVAIFGTLMERRHGPVVVAALFLIGGVGGMALAGKATGAQILGANGAALALLTAWAVPDLMRLARKREYEGDLLATAVIGAVLALMPLADLRASWVAAGFGIGAGLLLGYVLGKIHPV
jgi:membrane associated rhomboid family serine protease